VIDLKVPHADIKTSDLWYFSLSNSAGLTEAPKCQVKKFCWNQAGVLCLQLPFKHGTELVLYLVWTLSIAWYLILMRKLKIVEYATVRILTLSRSSCKSSARNGLIYRTGTSFCS
jgi:hypothetical protein